MDLLSISQAIWRHKLAALPIVLFMILGTIYIFNIKPPVYQASASLLLVPPPDPPTSAQSTVDPRLGRINSNNPYVNLGNLDLVADVVIDLVTAPSAQQALVREGADPRYDVVISTDFESPPIVDITGVGSSAAEAIKSADLVTSAAAADLNQIQQKQGVNSYYLIRGVQLVQPRTAQETVSSKLRDFIVVIALGVIALFVVISVMDVADRRPRSRVASAGSPADSAADSASDPPAGARQREAQVREAAREPVQAASDETMPFRIDASRLGGS
jgi:capsular polysaccharide biosynthesis protein